MKYRKFLLIILLGFILFPVINVSAYEYKEKIKNSFTVYYLVDLNEGDELNLELTPYENGNFTLFLFNERIIKSHIFPNGSVNPEIYEKAMIYDLSENPSISYTAEEFQIYYIQIILMENGPDIFILNSNHELSRYYLPQIPGIPLEILLMSSIILSGLLIISISRKITFK